MIKFVMAYHPTALVVSACQKAGMKEGDGTSLWDWVDPSYGRRETIFPSFESAKEDALTKISEDVFGAPRVEKYEWHGDPRAGSWQEVCFWEITGPDASETNPDFIHREN